MTKAVEVWGFKENDARAIMKLHSSVQFLQKWVNYLVYELYLDASVILKKYKSNGQMPKRC